MNCKKIENILLTDYIDGNLKGEALRGVEEHLAACERCRGLAGRAVSSGDLLKAAGMQSPPGDLWNKIRAGIISEEARPGILERVVDPLRYFFTHLKPVVAAVAVAVLVVFTLTMARPPVEQDDIMGLASLDEEVDESEYNFGTPLEEYFL